MLTLLDVSRDCTSDAGRRAYCPIEDYAGLAAQTRLRGCTGLLGETDLPKLRYNFTGELLSCVPGRVP
jgi:hypothetical protein